MNEQQNECSHTNLVKLSGPMYDHPVLQENPAGKLYVCDCGAEFRVKPNGAVTAEKVA